MRHKKLTQNYSLWFFVSLLFWGLATIAHQEVYAGPEEQCLDCHDGIWQEGLAQGVIHQPFLDKQCQACHVNSPANKNSKQDNPERKHVKWIGRHFTPDKTHWFKFATPGNHGTLFIEAGADRGKTLQQQLPLPPLGNLPRYDNDHTPPIIHNVQVVEVSKGLFLSATISWQTDEIASSVVNYGITKLNMSSPLKNSYTTSHQVTLTGLKSKTTYQFKVVSEDLFGNQAISDLSTLATDKTFPQSTEEPLPPAASLGTIDIDTTIFQSNNQYLVKITTNQPVKMALGSMPTTTKQALYVKDSDSTQEVKHVLTTGGSRLNISICYSCHRKYQEGMSHPVNVYPKRGIVIPPEYPTLPDGRMTCMSCHARHASNLSNRLIKSSKRALCVGCHRDMK